MLTCKELFLDLPNLPSYIDNAEVIGIESIIGCDFYTSVHELKKKILNIYNQNGVVHIQSLLDNINTETDEIAYYIAIQELSHGNKRSRINEGDIYKIKEDTLSMAAEWSSYNCVGKYIFNEIINYIIENNIVTVWNYDLYNTIGFLDFSDVAEYVSSETGLVFKYAEECEYYEDSIETIIVGYVPVAMVKRPAVKIANTLYFKKKGRV